MIRYLAAHTFRNHLLTFRFSIGVAMAIAMVVAVTLVQLQDQDTRARAAAEYGRVKNEIRDGITAWSMVRNVLVLPPSELTFMAKGISGQGPNRVEISAGLPATLLEMGRYHAVNPLLDFLPDPDVSSIAAYFFSFLAILLSYDLVSGAREQGMLRMLLASGVGRIQLIAGLALGGALTLALIVVLSLGAVLATVQWASSLSLSASQMLALLIMGVEILLYCFLFFAIGLLCSCLCRRSNLSLLFALLAWIALVVAVPPLAAQLVTQLDPLPTGEAIEGAEQSLDDDFQQKAVEFYEENTPTGNVWYGWTTGNVFDFSMSNAHYIVRSDFDELIRFRRKMREYLEPLREAAVGRLQALQVESGNRMWRQAEQIRLTSSLSPAAILRRLCATAAGTDPQTLHRFVESARKLRKAYVDFQRSKGYVSLDFTTDQHRNRERLSLDGLPPEPRTTWEASNVLANSTLDFSLLIAYLAALLLVIGVVFNRYDVR